MDTDDEQQAPQTDTPAKPDLLQVPPVATNKRAFAPSPSKATAPAKKLAAGGNSQRSPKPIPFTATTPGEEDDLFFSPKASPRTSAQPTTNLAPRPLPYRPLPNRQRNMPETERAGTVEENTEEGRTGTPEEMEKQGAYQYKSDANVTNEPRTDVSMNPPTSEMADHQTAPTAPPQNVSTTYNRPRRNTDTSIAANGKVTHMNGFLRTAAPTGGFPVPQLGASVWKNQKYRDRWSKKEGPKAWVRIWKAGFDKNRFADDFIMVEGIIKKAVDATNLVLSGPAATTPPTSDDKDKYPWYFLVSGMSQQDTDKLISYEVISCEAGTIFILPFEQPTPKYIGTLAYFALDDSEDSNRIVEEAVRETLTTSAGVIDFYTKHAPKDGPTIKEVIDSTRASGIQLFVKGGKKTTVWNIYFDNQPHFTFDVYLQWAIIIRQLEFPTEDRGTGTMQRKEQLECRGCKSLEHPLGLCPFERILGWMGPKVSASEQVEEYTLQALERSNTERQERHGEKQGGHQSRGGRGRRGRGRRGF